MIGTIRKAKFRRPQPEPRPCGGCGVPTKGGRCIKCRVQKSRGLEVDGLACRIGSCGIALARVLKLVRFGDDLVPLCANHAALAGKRGLSWQQFEAEAEQREAELTPAAPAVALRRVG